MYDIYFVRADYKLQVEYYVISRETEVGRLQTPSRVLRDFTRRKLADYKLQVEYYVISRETEVGRLQTPSRVLRDFTRDGSNKKKMSHNMKWY